MIYVGVRERALGHLRDQVEFPKGADDRISRFKTTFLNDHFLLLLLVIEVQCGGREELILVEELPSWSKSAGQNIEGRVAK